MTPEACLAGASIVKASVKASETGAVCRPKQNPEELPSEPVVKSRTEARAEKGRLHGFAQQPLLRSRQPAQMK